MSDDQLNILDEHDDVLMRNAINFPKGVGPHLQI